MACGCSDRMRKFILPSAGFHRDGDNWVNETFPEEQYRIIPDKDVDDHHTILTAYIGWMYGQDRIKKVLTWLTNYEVEDIFKAVPKFLFGKK